MDEEPPICISNDLPSCEGYNTAETCAGGWWSVQATLQDSESGV